MGISQTEQTKNEYWPDGSVRIVGIEQTEQTKFAIGQTEGAVHIFSRDHWVGPHKTPLSATQVGLAKTCLGSRISSWAVIPLFFLIYKQKKECVEINFILGKHFLFQHNSVPH